MTATQVRNALVETANPNLLGDKSRINDQGKGFLNVPAALNRLKSGQASKLLPDVFHFPTPRSRSTYCCRVTRSSRSRTTASRPA